MIVYQAPNKVDWFDARIKTSIFLAGGISGCKNWQKDLIDELQRLRELGLFDLGGLVIFNPRRDDFDMENPNATVEQIKWEHKCLEKCDMCSFFFPASNTVQPITLYELGKYQNCKPVIIGIEDGYLRTEDVVIQCALDQCFCTVYSDYIDAIREHARKIAIMYDGLRRNRV